MIQLTISDNTFYVDNFPEKKTDLLKKKSGLKLTIPFYQSFQTPQEALKVQEQIDYLKNLKELPNYLMFHKSSRYFWGLGDCKLLNLTSKKLDHYYEFQRSEVTLTISYDQVFGSSNLKLLNRTQKLDELLNT